MRPPEATPRVNTTAADANERVDAQVSQALRPLAALLLRLAESAGREGREGPQDVNRHDP
jgi:hypothetical protein